MPLAVGSHCLYGNRSLKLDDLDIKILAVLQREGRITKLRLAQEIGLSPSPCWERLKRLEQAGYIRGYHADIDLLRLLHTTTVFVEITLNSHEAEDFHRFEAAIKGVPEVVECCAVGGGIDYVVKVVVRDIEHYQQLMDRMLEAEIGIGKYFTYIVTKPVVPARPASLRHLMDGDAPAAPKPQK